MTELSEALGVSSLDEQELDSLVAWAKDRADALCSQLHDDPELGPLLQRGGQSTMPVERTARRHHASHDESATVAAPVEVAREDSKLRQPLPPIPSAQPGYEAPPTSEAASHNENVDENEQENEDDDDLEELDEVELLDDDDLELVEESLRGPTPTPEPQPEWKAALATAQEGDELAAEAKANNRTEDSALIRLRAEEEDLRAHDVDLSDLDID
jgi:hypothetical protein